MKKVLSTLIFIISFFIFLPTSNASCTYKRLSDLKKLASNVNVTYTYNIVNNKATFDIRFANLTSDIYLYDTFNDKKYIAIGEITLKNFTDGAKYRFFINSNDKDCKDDSLITKYVTLPKYNIFYGDEICKGIEDYALCQKWGSFNVEVYSDYITQIKKYKASLVEKEDVKVTEKEETVIEKVVDFFINYYIFILPAIIIICSILIVYLARKDKFNF